MRRAKAKRILPFFALLVVACSPPRPPASGMPAAASVPVEAVYPLEPGRSWSYRVRDLRKGWTYRNDVRIVGPRELPFLEGPLIEVQERYSSLGMPAFVEEREPLVYFRRDGFLHRVFLTYQAGDLIPQSGSEDSRFLPAVLVPGESWTSETKAFRVGEGLGMDVAHEHVVAREDDPVDVPAGRFRGTLRVDTFTSHGENTGRRPGEEIVFFYSDWYAPGIGLVLSRQWDDAERTDERSRIELLSYDIPEASP